MLGRVTDPAQRAAKGGADLGSDATMEMPASGASAGTSSEVSTRSAVSALSPPVGPLQLAIGSVFAGRYVVEGLLGRGGMGVVYRARDRLVDERIALKLLDVGGQIADDAVEMFRREVRVARRITHANVVRIHDLDQHDERMFITMELVEGSDLRREMQERGGKIPPVRAARVALEVARGLGAAHAIGVVHRDLKPENVLVDAAGRCILSDFGIARVFDGAGSDASRATRVIGTPAYMAPEQVAAEELGPASDLYALGVVLFEMLSGQLPFVGDNPIAVAIARLQQPAPDVRTICAQPELLAQLVTQCLEREPKRRPANAEGVASALESFLESAPDDAAVESRRPHVSPQLAPRAPAKTARGARASRSIANASSALPFGTGRSSLACLPFTYRGPAEHDYLGEAVSGELIDVLSRTKGLRVLSSGALAKTEERDPRKLTEDLDVDYVVDGTVQISGPKLRISVRLVDATGAQLFSERFDIGFGDLFDMQDEAGRRIAEALRLELVTRAIDADVPDDAMQLYLQARRILRSQLLLEAPKAVVMLENVLAASPAFTPALGSLAIATVAVWFYPQGDKSRDWEAAADSVVTRALDEASDIVETHVAAARVASHRGKLREAISALRRALQIAPTSPEAHHILGQLECETGRTDEGLARLVLAHQLEPTAVYPYEAARVASFRKDEATFDRNALLVRKHQSPLVALHLELRHGGWWNDPARLANVIAQAPSLGAPFDRVFDLTARAYMREIDPLPVVSALGALMPHVNTRFGNLFRQILVEVHCRAGDVDGALEWLREAQSTVLYDVAWLERCPILEPLRQRPEFLGIVSDVKARCDSVWVA